jgi:hypothetical protein
MYNFVTGLVYLPASVIAGALWVSNPAYAFIFAAVIASIAMISFIYLKPWNPRISTKEFK